jgi:amidohydrolase
MGTQDSLMAEAGQLLDEAIELRRRIHRHPETGLDLPETQEAVLESLSEIDLKAHTGRTLSSVVATIEGKRPGPTVLLRADMDALEMPEDTGLEFASEVSGRMHACGHDAHVAMLVGAARLLQRHQGELAGRVVLMFQPGEEGHDGAKAMLEEGLLDKHGPVDRAFAIHITPILPSGWVACRPGPALASADEFRIRLTGAGGHASMPHDAIDPVPAACETVLALQSMVTRTVPVFDPGVITVTTLEAGTAFNVIPESAICGGTIRAVSDSTRDLLIEGMRRVASQVAAAHRCTAELQMMPHSYPVTINDPASAEHALEVAQSLLGPERVLRMPNPVMGAEDWSYVLQKVPGCIAFLGAAPPGVNKPAPNHSNRMLIDEAAMATGIALYAAVALSLSEGRS